MGFITFLEELTTYINVLLNETVVVDIKVAVEKR